MTNVTGSVKLHVPPIQVAIKSPTRDGGSFGDELTQVLVNNDGRGFLNSYLARSATAEALRTLAKYIVGTEGGADIDSAEITVLFRHRKRSDVATDQPTADIASVSYSEADGVKKADVKLTSLPPKINTVRSTITIDPAAAAEVAKKVSEAVAREVDDRKLGRTQELVFNVVKRVKKGIRPVDIASKLNRPIAHVYDTGRSLRRRGLIKTAADGTWFACA
jgi:hypothetical protein